MVSGWSRLTDNRMGGGKGTLLKLRLASQHRIHNPTTSGPVNLPLALQCQEKEPLLPHCCEKSNSVADTSKKLEQKGRPPTLQRMPPDVDLESCESPAKEASWNRPDSHFSMLSPTHTSIWDQSARILTNDLCEDAARIHVTLPHFVIRVETTTR